MRFYEAIDAATPEPTILDALRADDERARANLAGIVALVLDGGASHPQLLEVIRAHRLSRAQLDQHLINTLLSLPHALQPSPDDITEARAFATPSPATLALGVLAMNRTTLVSALVTGSALVGAGYFLSRRPRPRALASNIIPIITPVIDLRVAEDVLEAMERIPGDEVTVVLHTLGGCVTSCVLIANALRQFPQSTAVVPYMATSGGTLIALNARHCRWAAAPRCRRSTRSSRASAPSTCRRSRRTPRRRSRTSTRGDHALPADTLMARLPGIDEKRLWDTVDVFMGSTRRTSGRSAATRSPRSGSRSPGGARMDGDGGRIPKAVVAMMATRQSGYTGRDRGRGEAASRRASRSSTARCAPRRSCAAPSWRPPSPRGSCARWPGWARLLARPARGEGVTMQFSMLNLIAGRRHQFGALVLMRGETFLETIEEGGMAVVDRAEGHGHRVAPARGAQVGLHLTPRRGEPVWLTSPGTYCVVAKDHVVGMRMLRAGGEP
jgi:hypothetical protein